METKLRAILVDDEESARSVLSSLLARFCPQIEVVCTCSDVPQAVEAVKKESPDVLFLDIEMPNYAGFEIVSFFDQIDFEIVFVTAYDQYAIKAFEVSAVDYLLKPVEISRLKQAVDKLVKKQVLKQANKSYQALTENLKSESVSKIVVRQHGSQEVLATQSIIAIEAQEAYSCIYTQKDSYLVSKNLKHYENLLQDHQSFFRSHKSWLINMEHVVKFSKSKLEIELTANIKAKLSKYKKPEFDALVLS